MTFNFEGDDDVWAFINNRLVMDIGGIHPTAIDSINVDSLGLTNNKKYSFDFFYCERHVTGSDIRITTNIIAPPPPTDLIYSTNPASYIVGTPITPNKPSSQGLAVASYSVTPLLP